MDATDELERLMGLMTGDEKHSVAATSTLDVVRVLYERVLDVSPETVGDERRDRFYLSKGHGPMAYYAVLADRGFIPEDWLAGWASYDSPLGYHPDRNLVP
ncbi:MAG TPA: transketolase, partial [Nocardioides sp.]|nr:transketolase [Nocardioides sp.]